MGISDPAVRRTAVWMIPAGVCSLTLCVGLLITTAVPAMVVLSAQIALTFLALPGAAVLAFPLGPADPSSWRRGRRGVLLGVLAVTVVVAVMTAWSGPWPAAALIVFAIVPVLLLAMVRNEQRND